VLLSGRLVLDSSGTEFLQKDVMRVCLELRSLCQDTNSIVFPTKLDLLTGNVLRLCTLLLKLTYYYCLPCASVPGFLGNHTEFGRWSSTGCTAYFVSYIAFPAEAKISCYPSSSPCQLSVANTCKFKQHDFIMKTCCLYSEILMFTWTEFCWNLYTLFFQTSDVLFTDEFWSCICYIILAVFSFRLFIGANILQHIF